MRCKKCGLMKMVAAKRCGPFSHRYKWDRRKPRGVLTCVRCDKEKDKRPMCRVCKGTGEVPGARKGTMKRCPKLRQNRHE